MDDRTLTDAASSVGTMSAPLTPATPSPEPEETFELRTDGPTIEEYIAHGFGAATYPPDGYAEKPSAGLERFRASGFVELGGRTVPDWRTAARPDSKTAAKAGSVPALPPRLVAMLELGPAAADLLAEACYVFGVNPDPTFTPKEILPPVKFRTGDPFASPPIAPTVTFVTAGGLKICYPVDDATEERLRVAFGAYRIVGGEKVVLPLPEDLTLTTEQRNGVVVTDRHVYRTGYLREGGQAEAIRRATVQQLRQAGRLK